MAEETLVLFKNIRNPKYSKSLEGYKKAGGYQTLKKVFGMKPEEVVQTVKDSGVRGRGGAGFPCLLYTSPSPRDGLLSRMPSSA